MMSSVGLCDWICIGINDHTIIHTIIIITNHTIIHIIIIHTIIIHTIIILLIH